MSDPKVKLFLDSGAYTAWSRGKKISVSRYIRFLKEYQDILFAYVTLDTIPGKFGKRRTQADGELAAQKTYETTQRILDAGLNPIPVIHEGEEMQWLERYIDEGHPYIGISISKESFARSDKWLNQAFTVICDKDGKPRVKVHGFGITTPSIIATYPFHTVDSTTWLLSPAYGHIMVPHADLKGGFDFTKPPMRVITSKRGHSTGSRNALNYANLGPYMQKYVEKYARDILKTNLFELDYDVFARRRSVVTFLELFSKHVTPVHFNRHQALLTKERGKGRDVDLHVIHVVPWQPHTTNILMEADAHYHLISYLEIRDRDPDDIREYIETGHMRTRSIAKRRTNWNDTHYISKRFLRLHRRINDCQDGQSALAGEPETS